MQMQLESCRSIHANTFSEGEWAALAAATFMLYDSYSIYIYIERESRGSIALAMLLHAALFDRLMSLEKVATDLISILFPHLFNNHVITTCLVH